MNSSISMANTGAGSQLCPNAIGVGKAGCEQLVELLTRGEIEDLLTDNRARVAFFAVDIGDKYLKEVKRAGNALIQRLENRGISSDRVHIDTWNIVPPTTDEEKDGFFASLQNLREYLLIEYPRQYWNPNYEPWVSEDDTFPKEGEHTYRSMGKALYYDNYYRLGMKQKIAEFARFINDTEYPGIVYFFYGLAGGLSGAAMDLARHVSNIHFGRRQSLVGFGFLPSSLDEEAHKGASFYASISENECLINPEANGGVIAVWGETMRNPWTGGFFAVDRECNVVRMRAVDKKEQEIGASSYHRVKVGPLQVANRSTNLILADFLVTDGTRQFQRATVTANGRYGWTTSYNGERSWNILYPTQIIHPAAEVPVSNNNAVLRQEAIRFMDYFHHYDGLTEEFKTDYINLELHGCDSNTTPEVQAAVENYVKRRLHDNDSGYKIHTHNSYDESTIWMVAMVPGVALRDFKTFYQERDKYDAIEDWDERFRNASLNIDLGTFLLEPSIRHDGMIGECIWGCACFVVYPWTKLRGDSPTPPTRPEIWAAASAPLVEAIVSAGALPGEAETQVS